MDRVTPLLQQAQVGEGIFLEGRVSELGGQGEGRPRAPFTFGASLDWDRINGAFPLQPLGAAWKDLPSTAPKAARPQLRPRRSRLLLSLCLASLRRLSLYLVTALPARSFIFLNLGRVTVAWSLFLFGTHCSD